VGHVQAAMLDLAMQMLTSILPHAETGYLRLWIQRELL
jgi:hypothetical protein